jgi:hypothetical protein
MQATSAILSRFSLWLVAALLSLAVCGPAHATTLRKMSLDQMIDESALVARVQAAVVDPNAYDSSTRRAYTRVVFQVREALSGTSPAPTLEFYLRGGITPSGKIQDWVGLPKFVKGENYLVFIKGGPYHVTPFTNFANGVYREVTVGGRTVFVSDAGRGVVGLDGSGVLVGQTVAESSNELLAKAMGWGSKVLADSGPVARPTAAAVRLAAAQCMTASDVSSELRSRITDLRATASAQRASTPAIVSRPDPITASKE